MMGHKNLKDFLLCISQTPETAKAQNIMRMMACSKPAVPILHLVAYTY